MLAEQSILMLVYRTYLGAHTNTYIIMQARSPAYPVDVGSKLPSEDEAVNALLQAGNVHNFHKVALNCAQLLRVTHALVLGMLTLSSKPCVLV